MYKAETYLTNFRFNSFTQQSNFKVTWFYFPSEDSDEDIRCFTDEEVKAFLDYAVSNPINFEGDTNKRECDEEETPYISEYDFLPTLGARFPQRVILKQKPQLSLAGNVFDSMDIILTDSSGNDRHKYNLSFDAIGVIKGLK